MWIVVQKCNESIEFFCNFSNGQSGILPHERRWQCVYSGAEQQSAVHRRVPASEDAGSLRRRHRPHRQRRRRSYPRRPAQISFAVQFRCVCFFLLCFCFLFIDVIFRAYPRHLEHVKELFFIFFFKLLTKFRTTVLFGSIIGQVDAKSPAAAASTSMEQRVTESFSGQLFDGQPSGQCRSGRARTIGHSGRRLRSVAGRQRRPPPLALGWRQSQQQQQQQQSAAAQSHQQQF